MSGQVAADLRAAAEVLRRDGWTQGTYVDPNSGSLCLVGALDYVYGPRDFGGIGDPSESESYEALKAVIGDQSPIAWNDARGRTADEVIAALEAAADAADRKAAYDEGRWCGECQYGVVTDPPCCTQGPDEPQSGDRS